MGLAAALESRLFSLQITQGYLNSKGQASALQKNIPSAFYIKRGSILAQDKTGKLYSLALDKEGYKVWLDKQKSDLSQLTPAAADLLGIKQNELKDKISQSQQNRILLSDFIDKDSGQKLKNMKISGLSLEPRDKRVYPFNDLASHILGFVTYQESQPFGQYGLEEYYDSKLSGLEELEKQNSTENQYITGKSLVLSIDYNMQLVAEKTLSDLIEKNKSQSGSITIMDPKTGEIIALASMPKFNPNEYSKYNLEDFKNNAIQENYEPGSVLKLLTMAAGLQEGAVTPATTYEDFGFVKVKNTTFWNFDRKANKTQTMTQVLEKSLNTGAVFVEQKISKFNFLNYTRKFGLGARTGIDLSGETKGDIRNLFEFKDVDYAAASFGQGITATPIQIASIVSAIANNGVMLKPHIVKKIINPDNTKIEISPEILSEPIKPMASAQLTGMMVSVANNGLDKRAKIPGYQIAVKTGTAQIADLEVGGYSEDTVHTIAGFAPAFNPKFVIVMRLDKPKGAARFASDSLGLTFRNLTETLLNYYQIPPSEPSDSSAKSNS